MTSGVQLMPPLISLSLDHLIKNFTCLHVNINNCTLIIVYTLYIVHTVSLFLIKIAKIPQPPKSRFTQGCVLLTVHPLEIAGKDSGMEFHRYIPPKR